MYIKTDGIVLREVAYQDSDKLLTVLTREYGKLTVRARGVRSSRSRSKAACQLLAYSEFTLLERGGRYVVTEATAKEMFPELRNDLELFCRWRPILRRPRTCSARRARRIRRSYHCCSTPSMRSAGSACRRLVKAVFELRAMCLSGYEPDLRGCAVCGTPGRTASISHRGVLQCAACRAEERTTSVFP